MREPLIEAQADIWEIVCSNSLSLFLWALECSVTRPEESRAAAALVVSLGRGAHQSLQTYIHISSYIYISISICISMYIFRYIFYMYV